MGIEDDVSLKPYNTFGIDVKAKQFVSVSTVSNLQKVLRTNKDSELFILGGGSNMLLTKDIDAMVVHIDLKGIEVLESSGNNVSVKANAGENWHEFVVFCIKNNLGGLENLSLIPGNVGTAPIQNIGAYGVELKDVFKSCDAVNISTGKIETFKINQCDFDYRHSIFKTKLKGKYIITSVTFNLTTKNHELKTSYGAITDELKSRNITQPTIKNISDAVISIRKSKLPDPNKIGNSGSFFKNPIVSKKQFDKLKKEFPTVPSYPISQDKVKVPAGWLIEKAGLKGKRFGNYGVHKKQALVLVNYGNASGKDLLQLSRLIQLTVSRLFDINIEAEVNIV